MKVIDLLNKIANNEEVPKKICYEEYIWTWNGETYDNKKECLFEDYINKKYVITDVLNDEIEIIEEKPKKIEEIKNRYDKQAIINYKQANFNSTDMKEICKTIGFLMQYLDEARDTINDLTKAVNYLLEKESDK